MGNHLTRLKDRVRHFTARKAFWMLVLGTYSLIFLVTIDQTLLNLAKASFFLKLVELPLYASAYLLLLPSVKILYSLLFYPLLRWKQKRVKALSHALRWQMESQPVALLYPTYNDFNAEALTHSRAQSTPFWRTFILDDSTHDESIAKVDAYASAHENVEVVRRSVSGGYKAGNMNAFLRQRKEFGLFVVMDSDQRLAPDFLARALAHLDTDERIGIVQSRPMARASDNSFTKTYAPIFNAYIKVSQFVRTQTGFSMFMGRGALIRKTAYDQVGGFPELVMEDVPFSFELAEQGWRTSYIEDLASVEEYPTDYIAFRKQQRKTAEGNAEFMKLYWLRILASRLPLRQRVDLLAEHLFVLAGAFFGFLLFLSNIFSHQSALPSWMLAIFGLAGIAPILPGVLGLLKTRWFLLAPILFVRTSFLYGSTLRSSLMGILRVLHGKQAVFHVTPKAGSAVVSMAPSTKVNGEHAKDAKYVVYLSLLSLLLTGSIFSALIFSLPVIVAFISGFLAYQGFELGALTLLISAGLLKAAKLRLKRVLAVIGAALLTAVALTPLMLNIYNFSSFASLAWTLLISGATLIWLRYYAKATPRFLKQTASALLHGVAQVGRDLKTGNLRQRLASLLDIS